MGVADKIAELEAQMARTQKNKATEAHLGLLKAKIARLKKEADEQRAGGKGGGTAAGFDVKKSGNATVVLIGLPSVGKSSLLNALTGAQSKTAAYAFTTVKCIPGMMEYKGAQIQVLDLPGVIAGAEHGRGRGREVVAVARSADLVLFVLDVFEPFYLPKLKQTIESIGVRLDCQPPRIVITRTQRGGLDIVYEKKQSQLNDKLVASVLGEYGIFSANVTIREDATVDQLIDVLVGNRVYASSLAVVNKVDLVTLEFLKKVSFEFIPVSAEKKVNTEKLKQAIYEKLKLVRVFTRSRFEGADKDEPLIVREGATIAQAVEKISRGLRSEAKAAKVWGPSAKHPGQRVGLEHVLKDGDTFMVEKRR